MIESTLSNDHVTSMDYEDANLSLLHEEHLPVKQNGMITYFRLTICLFISTTCGSDKSGKNEKFSSNFKAYKNQSYIYLYLYIYNCLFVRNAIMEYFKFTQTFFYRLLIKFLLLFKALQDNQIGFSVQRPYSTL